MENTYDKLIDSDGQPHIGVFSRPVQNINYQDFAYHTPMDRRGTRWEKHFAFNQFQFVGVCSEDLVFGCALVDIKYIGNAFVYLYERASGNLREFSFMMPLGWRTHLSTTPDAGTSHFQRGDIDFRLTSRNHPREKYLQIKVGKTLTADLTVTEPSDFQPLALCTPTGFNGWTYTQKAAGLDVSGFVRLEDRRYEFTNAHKGSYDWSCGFMRRETAWNWACLSGKSEAGLTLGVNFANGVNETSFTENAFWVDGRMTKVNQIRFIYPKQRRHTQWRIESDDGKVKLRFEPEGARQEKLNLFVLATNFTQLFGRFYGTLVDDNGEVHTLNGVTGFAEDHYAKW